MFFSLSSCSGAVLGRREEFLKHSSWLEKKHEKVKEFVGRRNRRRGELSLVPIRKKINKKLKSKKKQSIHSADTSVQICESPRKRFRRRLFVSN